MLFIDGKVEGGEGGGKQRGEEVEGGRGYKGGGLRAAQLKETPLPQFNGESFIHIYNMTHAEWP